MSQGCSPPQTGVSPCSGNDTYSEALGSDYILFMSIYSVLTFTIIALLSWKFFARYLMPPCLNGSDLGGANGGNTRPLFTSLHRHRYKSFVFLSLLFIVMAIDPLGYRGIFGIYAWNVLSYCTTAVLLLLGMSIHFFKGRKIALSTRYHDDLQDTAKRYTSARIVIFLNYFILRTSIPSIQSTVAFSVLSSFSILTTVLALLYFLISMHLMLKKAVHQFVHQHGHPSGGDAQNEKSQLELISELNMFNLGTLVFIVYILLAFVELVLVCVDRRHYNFTFVIDIPSDFGDVFANGSVELTKLVISIIIIGYSKVLTQSAVLKVSRVNLCSIPSEETVKTENTTKRDQPHLVIYTVDDESGHETPFTMPA